MRVLVTGASGFVGRHLCSALVHAGFVVRGAVRSNDGISQVSGSERVVVGEIGPNCDWARALSGVDAVIHAAARAHVLGDRAGESVYMTVNELGTRRLAVAAAKAQVKRFIFLSTIKVNGEEANRRFMAGDPPNPQDAYARSKLAAERHLWQIAGATSMEVVIVRPPLIYGPGVRANFLRLLHWVEKERLLPFGAIRNSRSLLSVWNLCDLLIRLLTHGEAAGRLWMASDNEDLSTPELVCRLAAGMRRNVRLIPLSDNLLLLLGQLVGKRAEVMRLCSSLAVDIGDTLRLLSWTPPLSVDEGLTRTAQWYLAEGRHGDS